MPVLSGPSKSEFRSPVWMVPKKDGKWRFCLDLRELNKKIKKDSFPLPILDEMLDAFQGARYMSSHDMFWGFYHVKLKEDIHKTAF